MRSMRDGGVDLGERAVPGVKDQRNNGCGLDAGGVRLSKDD